MSDAFTEEGRAELAACRGRWPHLRIFADDGCQGQQRALLLGASNSWFPLMLSALSIPSTTDKLGQLIEANWVELENCEEPTRRHAQSETLTRPCRLYRCADSGRRSPEKARHATERGVNHQFA